MSLINCPECKTEVSDQAVTCPKCGIQIKSSSSLFSIVKWIAVLSVIGASSSVLYGYYVAQKMASAANEEYQMAQEEYAREIERQDQLLIAAKEKMRRKKAVLENIKFNNKWGKEARGMVYSLKNSNSMVLKDVEITCYYYANSGTQIGSWAKTLYDSFPANKTTSVEKFGLMEGTSLRYMKKSKTYSCVATNFRL